MKTPFRKLMMTTLVMLISITVVHAESIHIPRLSPLPTDWKTSIQALNGQWLFNPAPEESFWQTPNTHNCKTIEVPGEWVMQGFTVEKGQKAGYYRIFSIPSNWKGKRIKLRCNAIYSEALIYINGKETGSHTGGFTAFEFDITPHILHGQENTITVAVTNEGLADSLSNGSRYAAHPLGGITRDIFLFALDEVNFSMFHATTDFDEDYIHAVLKTEVEITNESLTAKDNLQLQFSLKDSDGTVIPIKDNIQALERIIPGGKTSKTYSFAIEKPKQWTSEHPYLYTLVCELKDGNNTTHSTTRNIGFREIEVRGNQMFVNNKPVKLRGVCRHEVMPLRGRSLTGNIWEEDVRLFREANVNYIRTSHYPPDEALLDACDKLGMFVEVEAPFCWAHEANVEAKDHDRLLVNQHVEMVNRDRSHPSVIMWSLGNESNKYEEYFSKAAGVIRTIDPSRPRIFSQWSPEADNGEMEITNHHYPGPNGPNMYRNYKRPVVFDEFCHLNSYNRFELATDPGIRNMWGVLLDRMWNDMYYSQGVLGGALWAGIDDTFFIPGGGAVGYGTWGPIDGWRRPKPEYWNVKKAFSPVRIRQKGNINNKGEVFFDIENRHNFINLSECKFEWTSGNQQGTITVQAEPREKNQFKITLPHTLQAEDLYLVITSPLGYIIDEYNFQLLPHELPVIKTEDKSKIVLKESDNQLHIKTTTNTFIFNKMNGLISVHNDKNNVVIESTPTLMILPLNSEGRGIQMVGNDLTFEPYNPVCTNWICQSIEWYKKDNSFQIKVKGQYNEAEGSFVYEINGSGLFSVSYDFTILKDVNPRQTGLVFNLPAEFTHLSWTRKGYWNVYPEEHLGALSGSAVAFLENNPISGSAGPDKKPTVSWSYDQNKAGTNLFRSTKENIYTATLKSSHTGSIDILSNGEQHIRTWIDTDNSRINMLIADYNNAGGEGYLSPHAKKDYRPLKNGDKIGGKVVLRIKNQ